MSEPAQERPVDLRKTESRCVLIVDDSRLERKILSARLKKWGYSVLEAEDAMRAMEICRTVGPEIVLSDWMMPGMSGVEFCRALRAAEGLSYTYFILQTSKSEKSEIALGLEAGADDFLTKPADASELRARIRAGERILDMQARLTQQNRALEDALIEVERLNDALDSDLRGARELQQSLIPERHRRFGRFDLSLMLKSSGYVGGDLVGFYPAGPRHLGIWSLDVSGHGIGSALMTARLAGFLSAVAPDQNVGLSVDARGNCSPVPPAEVLSKLNRLVLEEIETEHYFTMLLGHLDLETGHLRLGQAGHPHPLIHRKTGEITQDSPGGFPIGLIEDVEFSEFDIQLNPGDRLLFHSDGITECPDPGDAMLGEEGLEAFVRDLRGFEGTEFFDAFMWKLNDFAGGPNLPDDVSMVLIDYR